MDIYAKKLYRKQPTKFDQRWEFYRYYKLVKMDKYVWQFIASNEYIKNRKELFAKTNIVLSRNRKQSHKTFNGKHYTIVRFEEGDLL